MTTTPPLVTPPPARIQLEDSVTVRLRARRRMSVIGGLLACALGVIALRGVQLAMNPDDRVLEIADEIRWASVSTQASRGRILDRDGNVFAESVKNPAIAVDPVAMQERSRRQGRLAFRLDDAARQLAEVLGLDPQQVLADVTSSRRYVRLARAVHPRVADRIRDLGLDDKGVIIEENYRRYYPQGQLGSQLVGFVDSDGVGRQGLEAAFDDLLSGTSGKSAHRVNRWGGLLDLFRVDPRRGGGHTVRTTISRPIQVATEQALARVMELSKPISATAVVVEVRTGRIVAMATLPGYDPNRVGSDFSTTHNLSVTAALEPGSVLKPFTMAGALLHGVVTLDELVDTTSPLQMYGVSIKDDHPHPALNVFDIVKYSSNVGASKLAGRLGQDRFFSVMQAFGFGELSGVETQGEAKGRRHPWGKPGPVELATVSFGQGTTATALQLAMATATIANDGVRMKPILIEELTDPYGRTLRSWEPIEVQRVVPPEIAHHVSRAMQMVTEPGGTGTRAAIPGYLVAGKTGTAQKPANGGYDKVARFSNYIGFAPADDPVFAMAIIVDDATVGSRYGGLVAAPVFASVIGAALDEYDIPPNPAYMGPTSPQPGDRSAAPLVARTSPMPAGVRLADAPPAPEVPVRVTWQDGAWALPDLSGRAMRDVLAGLQQSGLALVVEGSGRLAEMQPPAGTWVVPGEQVRLRFQ